MVVGLYRYKRGKKKKWGHTKKFLMNIIPREFLTNYPEFHTLLPPSTHLVK